MRTCRFCQEKFDEIKRLPRCCAPGRSHLPCEGKPRGFASLTPRQISAISAKGGRSAHASGNAHRFSPEEARLAGKVGGNAPHVKRGPEPLEKAKKTKKEESASPSGDG